MLLNTRGSNDWLQVMSGKLERLEDAARLTSDYQGRNTVRNLIQSMDDFRYGYKKMDKKINDMGALGI